MKLVKLAATDERNFVKKGVNWALRSIGMRNATLHKAAMKVAADLSLADNSTARWIGKDAVRDLSRSIVKKRIARRSA